MRVRNRQTMQTWDERRRWSRGTLSAVSLTMMSSSQSMQRVPAAMTLPGNAAIPRRPGSIRRTSNIDMHLNDPTRAHALVLSGAARDLVTLENGHTVIAEATVTAGIDDQGKLATLEARPESGVRNASAGSLVGLTVSGGFRDAVRHAYPDEVRDATPLALLLDDLPVAALISGYARLYEGSIPSDLARQSMKSDICSGWRSEGTMMTSVRAGTGVPVTLGPRAPSIADERDIDTDGWHAIGVLPIGSMRRRRLVDVHVEETTWNIAAMFRDTHVDAEGSETVLHEYTLTATVDAATHRLTSCAAVPRVLPWVECPVAAASADRLVGEPIEGVRDFVRASLRGTSTCTHLNDLLRSLGDVGTLADRLDRCSPDRS
jgi:Protein of unknown function (DUF2889)